MNFLFPLIILDGKKFESADTFEVFNNVFKPYISKFIKENKLFEKKT